MIIRSEIMSEYSLAVDIGASSGRLILGHIENGKIITEEIHRFKNGIEKQGEHYCWNIEHLFDEIIIGMKKCAEAGKIPESVGIDTWAVDFVLVDCDENTVGQTVSYRDDRTKGMDGHLSDYISEQELYARTGIQKQLFNTIYQLLYLKENHPDQLEAAESMLLIPDYLNFRLCGEKYTEYTNATTTQLVSPVTCNWDFDLINRLGLPERLFRDIRVPGTTVGRLSPEIEAAVGFNCSVVLPATHDTGSAVVALPTVENDTLYISSGTWSLMGTENESSDCTEQSRLANFTNEGGYLYRYRFLKNIMGLWMIQSVKKELHDKFSFDELCDAAAKSTIASTVDCNDSRFLKPESMMKAVVDACRETGQEIPQNPGDVAAVIYNSLARCYAETAALLEELTGKKYGAINIVGGGSGDPYLNRLTAIYSGRDVFAGPKEATALGNLSVQLIALGRLKNLSAARKCIANSFEIKKYSLKETNE